jgi:hypothetical protein
MTKDQDVLDVVQDLNWDFRDNSAFRKLLRACDKDASRRVVKSYIERLCKEIKENGR